MAWKAVKYCLYITDIYRYLPMFRSDVIPRMIPFLIFAATGRYAKD